MFIFELFIFILIIYKFLSFEQNSSKSAYEDFPPLTTEIIAPIIIAIIITFIQI